MIKKFLLCSVFLGSLTVQASSMPARAHFVCENPKGEKVELLAQTANSGMYRTTDPIELDAKNRITITGKNKSVVLNNVVVSDDSFGKFTFLALGLKDGAIQVVAKMTVSQEMDRSDGESPLRLRGYFSVPVLNSIGGKDYIVDHEDKIFLTANNEQNFVETDELFSCRDATIPRIPGISRADSAQLNIVESVAIP